MPDTPTGYDALAALAAQHADVIRPLPRDHQGPNIADIAGLPSDFEPDTTMPEPYFDGDDDLVALHCGRCHRPIVHLTHGDALSMVKSKAADHRCPDGFAPTPQPEPLGWMVVHEVDEELETWGVAVDVDPGVAGSLLAYARMKDAENPRLAVLYPVDAHAAAERVGEGA